MTRHGDNSEAWTHPLGIADPDEWDHAGYPCATTHPDKPDPAPTTAAAPTATEQHNTASAKPCSPEPTANANTQAAP